MKFTILALGSLLLSAVIATQFGGNASADAAPAGCAPGAKTDWGKLKEGGKDDDVFNGKPGKGTATVTNDGPGEVTITTTSRTDDPIVVPAGKTKHIQMTDKDKLIIEDENDADDNTSKGSAVFTPSCSDGGEPQPSDQQAV